jgi:hypothetical protein
MTCCIKCKHAKFILTPKKAKIARWGTGKCMAPYEVPTIDTSKLPAVIKITVRFREAHIDQGWLSYPEGRYSLPEECPLFEENQDT